MKMREDITVCLQRARSWAKSYAFARSRSQKGERFRLFLFGVIGLVVGMTAAWVVQSSYEAADRREAELERMINNAAPPAGTGRGEVRWLSREQIRLLLSR